jgi:hypothetical protein
MTFGQQDVGPTDRSSWTEVQRTKINNATSEVTTPQLARELYGDGNGNMELQWCKLALLQHYKLTTLQHCKLAAL